MDQFQVSIADRFKSCHGPGRKALTLTVFIFVLTAFSGCGILTDDKAGTPNTGAAAESPEAEIATGDRPAPESASGACENPYYPVDPGKVRKYRLDSQLPDGDREYTLKHKMVDEETFAEIRSYSSGLTLSVNWACSDEGLRMTQYVSEARMQAAQFQMETIESSGMTIPKDWKVGQEWTSTYEVKAKLDAGPVKQTADGTVTIDHKLAAEKERVSVPGGEFNAAMVDNVIKLNLRVGGRTVPAKDIRSSVWISPEVGIVKQRVYGDFGEETIQFIGFE